VSGTDPSEIREVVPSDLEGLYRLDQLCFEEGIAYSHRQLRGFLSIPTAQGLIAETGGRLAGFTIGYVARDGAGHVVTLDIHPRERRRGLGKILLEELLSRLRRAGARRAILEVAEENLGAIAFYETLGFHRRRRLPDYYAPRRPALEMGKDLLQSRP
jgi:ribosomal-protein-alanine N-acetyltransferase